ncbi:MAG: hypothetical protein C4331_13300 [Meiothermus sp.]
MPCVSVIAVSFQVLLLYRTYFYVNSEIPLLDQAMIETASTAPLVRLCHHRWAIPILAELHRTDGAKFVTLVNRLGLSRDALSRTLETLMVQGWVVKNPGYGHPLRPEYVLTPAGMLLGDGALGVFRVLQESGLEEPGLRKWTLPVIYALACGAERFSELLSLEGITGRALTLTLKDLEDSGLVLREVRPTRPPTSVYRLRGEAKPLAGWGAELVRGLEAALKS